MFDVAQVEFCVVMISATTYIPLQLNNHATEENMRRIVFFKKTEILSMGIVKLFNQIIKRVISIFTFRLNKEMTLMTKNLGSKFEAYDGYDGFETNAALSEIRSQLHELTRSVENCQSEVFEVKQDMISIKQEIDSVQFVKEEIDDIRDSIDRLESEGERRKAKLLEQVLFSVFLMY